MRLTVRFVAAALVLLADAGLQRAVGAEEPAAAERVTSIVGALKGGAHFGDGYVTSEGGCKIAQLSVVDAAGAKALKLEITGNGGSWSAGIARNGWVRWYLDDYGPRGALEFQVCGANGGETFRIGVSDSDKDGPQRPDKEVEGMVSIGKYAKLSKDWQKVRIPIADFTAAAANLDLADCIKMLVTNEGNVAPATFFIRDVRFTTTSPETPAAPVKLNQLGYRPEMRKVAHVTRKLDAFKIADAAGKTVFEGKGAVIAENDKASGDSVWACDFSEVRAPGKYTFVADGLPPEPFEIRDDIYDRLFVDAMRFYYVQRCGCELPEKHAGAWKRELCHHGDEKAVTRDGKDQRNVSGGWHDAGDCNKYPPWVRYPIFMMLDLHELRGETLADQQLNIPESGNGISDVLDEVQWELDWLLKMQIADGPQAGAVYDRIHENAAPKGGKHARLQEERRLLPPTADSTAIPAACWARAARTFAKIPARKEQAAKYLAAASLAFKRLEADKADVKLIFSAAGCLYDATGDAAYLKAAKDAFATLSTAFKSDFDKAERVLWDAYDCTVATLANSERDGEGLREQARGLLKAFADHAVSSSQKDAYRVPLWNLDHYCWSSSLAIGKFGYLALMANRYAPRSEYVQMAADNLHYLLGRNAVARCLVTGYGARSTDVYHSIYGGSAPAWQPLLPGVMGGGVNQMNSRGISAFPAKHYRSDPNNWTLTEPAVYYNAPLVFLSGYFAALKPQ